MDWENRYKSGDTPWNKGRAHPMLGEFPAGPPDSGMVLVPGCGAGWDVAELARRWSGTRILGLDLSPTAIEAARDNIAGLANAAVEEADFLAVDPRLPTPGSVGLVWEHTLFCAISPGQRELYARSVARVLAPGGILAGVFFLTLDDNGEGPPWNCPATELRATFRPWFEVDVLGPVERTFPGREGEEWMVEMRRRHPLAAE